MHFLNFLAEYGLFLLETITLVIAVLVIITGIFSIRNRNKPQDETLNIRKLNEKYADIAEELRSEILDKKALKAFIKRTKKEEKEKQEKSSTEKPEKRRTYVLDFQGDVHASAVEKLREEISSLLTIATPRDEVVVKLESGGGTVHGYGLGASQLQRIRDKKIRLTVCVDKVAASGGYLMACVADQIISAPFAIIGSIGVIIQMPNLNRFLKKHQVDYEMLTSGEYKRTISLFGENTDKGRKKCVEELEEIHHFFKKHIAEYRPQVDVHAIGTGEHWIGKKALELLLVDGIMTSDDYLMKSCEDNDVFEIAYEKKKTLKDKVTEGLNACTSGLLNRFSSAV